MKNQRTNQKRAYNEANYDRLAITIPKGQKATIQAAAEREQESINSFVNKAVLARIGLVDWPITEEKEP